MSLPSGYKRLEYIKSSGTQYINTGFQPNQDTRVVMDVQYIGTGSTSQWFFGCRGSRSTKYDFCVYNSKTVFYDTYSSKNVTYNVSDARHLIDKNKNVTSIDGSIVHTFSVATFSTGKNLYLLGLNNAGSLTRPAPAKLYSCQIYDNDVLIRDFVPCINTSGEVGLYDLVGKQFYGNAGKGTFTAGPVIAIAADKSEITKLKYIQSSGTQYIDTGVAANGNTGFAVDFSTTSAVSTSGYGSILGCLNSGSNRYEIGTYPDKSGGKLCYGSAIYNPYITVGNRLQVSLLNGSIKTPNGTETVGAQTFNVGVTITVFGRKRTDGSVDEFSKTKIYALTIYDNGNLVRDFIPCQKHDGTIGLYDKLNSLLYVNAGTGVFTAGPSSLNLPVNIGGTWKDANEVFVNISGTWKAVEAAFVNIGGTWKELG